MLIKDFEIAALKNLSPGMRDYVQKRAVDPSAPSPNLDAFRKHQILPRAKKADTANIRSEILGQSVSMPVVIGPTAWHKMFTPKGEAATYAAARARDTVYVVSCFSTMDFHEISPVLEKTWYQILIYKDPGLMLEYIARAEEAGCEAIVLTVDALHGCSMCKKSEKSFAPVQFPIHDMPLFPRRNSLPYQTLDEYYPQYMIGNDFHWDVVEGIISKTSLPVVVKGILSVEAARNAIRSGAKGIVVSNHGERQSTNPRASLEVLNELTQNISGEAEIYFDGGIRSGTDVFKGLALGAKAGFIGRAALYGLAANGERGLIDVLDILGQEVMEAMKLAGCSDINDIVRESLTHSAHPDIPRLPSVEP